MLCDFSFKNYKHIGSTGRICLLTVFWLTYFLRNLITALDILLTQVVIDLWLKTWIKYWFDHTFFTASNPIWHSYAGGSTGTKPVIFPPPSLILSINFWTLHRHRHVRSLLPQPNAFIFLTWHNGTPSLLNHDIKAHGGCSQTSPFTILWQNTNDEPTNQLHLNITRWSRNCTCQIPDCLDVHLARK